jgi:hypothetical protein
MTLFSVFFADFCLTAEVVYTVNVDFIRFKYVVLAKYLLFGT